MDNRDLKYKFDKARYNAANAVSNEESSFSICNKWSYIGMLVMMQVTTGVFVAVHDDPDQETTAKTTIVHNEISQTWNDLSSMQGFDKHAHQNFISSVLKAEDLSEEQALGFITSYEETYGDTETTVGYDIGSIDDLREVREKLGPHANAEEIAEGTVKKQKVEDGVKFAHRGSGVLFLLMGAIMGISAIPAISRAAKKRPRHPRFKH